MAAPELEGRLPAIQKRLRWELKDVTVCIEKSLECDRIGGARLRARQWLFKRFVSSI